MEYLHYIIIGLVITAIVVFQVIVHLQTIKKVNIFKEIFPNSIDSYVSKEKRIDEINEASESRLQTLLYHNGKEVENYFYQAGVFDREKAINDLIENYDNYEIIALHNNFILRDIISSINKYLVKNKGAVSDFHLMKDIVDRNCDTREDEINTQIPVPLYLGLMGTMVGILVGIGFLVFTGGLDALLSSSEHLAGKGVTGVRTLMGGVALAMVSSILGISLTTWDSNIAKNAKMKLEENKNLFLLWIQSELLPTLSNDISGALIQMTQNLNQFNTVFSGNTTNLKSTLENVNESYKNQAEILRTVNQLKIRDIAMANLEVYEKLKSCTDEIGELGGYLQNVKTYIVDLHQSIDNVGIYFNKEIEQMEDRRGVISRAVGTLDLILQKALDDLRDSSERHFRKFNESTVMQSDKLEKAIDQQAKAFQKKIEETSTLVTELKNLSAVKSSIENMVQVTSNQNNAINKLADSIYELVNTRFDEGRVSSFPKWAKFFLAFGFITITVSCIIFLGKELLNIIDKISFL